MRFKDFLEDGAATSLMHGGLYGLPFRTTNNNMPGIRSKYATKDGLPKEKIEDPSIPPEQLFGFRSPNARKAAPKTIDRERRRVPMRDDRPDIVY